MDSNECETVIAAARNTTGLTNEEILENLSSASRQFGKNSRDRFARDGEW